MAEANRIVFLAGSTQRAIVAAIPFAERVAAFNDATLEIWLADSSAHELGLSVDTPDWLEALGDNGEIDVDAVAARDVPEVIEQFAATHAPILAVAAVDGADTSTPYFRNLVAAPPCRLLFMVNAPAGFSPSRILVAVNRFGGLSEGDVSLAYQLAATGPGTHVTFLQVVGPDTSAEECAELEKRLAERVRERRGEYSTEVMIERARSFEVGVLEALEPGDFDLVIGDTPRSGLIARLSERILPARLIANGTPLLLYSQPTGRTARIVLGLWNVIYGGIPSTDEHSRVGIYTDVRRSSRADADYFVMLSLSVIIASLGLLLDSAAVVIGAMIVAPLMQPIIGIGLGISMGNGRLLEIGTGSVFRGVLVGLGLSMLVGFLTPEAEITGQLDARGQPQMLDLMIALASGAAGAYATCRKGVADTVAGVAIAVALVPPLATVGIGLALAEWPLAIGAALLLATNFVAIATASALMFLWVGFKPEPGRFGTQGPFVRGVVMLTVLVAVVAVSLLAWNRAGESRFDRNLQTIVAEAVQGIDPDAEVREVTTRDRDGSVLFVDVSIDTLDPPALQNQRLTIQSVISRELERPVDLRLRAVTLREEEN